MARKALLMECTRRCARLECDCAFVVPKPSAKGKYCSHSCAFAVIGAKVRAAAMMPEAIEKRSAKLRARGTGKSYPKLKGRHRHRVVMEQKLGRQLAPNEIVHHDDHNKQNFSEENLILTTRPEHSRMHNLGKKRPVVRVCKYGHDMVGDNVRVVSSGARRCVFCMRKYDREWKMAKKQQEREANV